MNQLINAPMQGAVSSVFAQVPAQDNDLGAGISGGYGLLGFKGKVWSIRHQGNDLQLMRDDGDGPRNSVDIVILKASPHLSKVWYDTGYVEGSNQSPDCYSTNGVTPVPSSPKKQADICKLCPRDAWGSARNQQGQAGKGKDCSDSKRTAIVPLQDLRNEAFGGPLLLRIPPASLQDLATFSNNMHRLGYPYYAFGMRVSFDPSVPYPKFNFQALRPLTDDEARIVIELQNAPVVAQILDETPVVLPGTQQQITPPANTQFAQGGGAPAAAFQQQAPVQPAPVAAASVTPVQPQPVVQAPVVTAAPPSVATPAVPATPALSQPVAPQPALNVAPAAATGFGPAGTTGPTVAPVTPPAAAPAAAVAQPAGAAGSPSGFGPVAGQTVTPQGSAPPAAAIPQTIDTESLDARLDAFLPPG